MTARQCFFIPLDGHDGEGYVPSMVIEGQPHHYPLVGNGPHAAPYRWGNTYEEACRAAEQANADLGLTPTEVLEIVASSMAVTRR